jgi:hypothetical protein
LGPQHGWPANDQIASSSGIQTRVPVDGLLGSKPPRSDYFPFADNPATYDLQEEGLGSANVPGLPRLAEARFFGSSPISRIVFEDRECPVKVSLEAFSPFQPLDAEASGFTVRRAEL